MIKPIEDSDDLDLRPNPFENILNFLKQKGFSNDTAKEYINILLEGDELGFSILLQTQGFTNEDRSTLITALQEARPDLKIQNR